MFVQTIEEEVPEFIAIFAISFGCGFKIGWNGGHKKHTICLNLFSFYSLNMRKIILTLENSEFARNSGDIQ